MSPLNDPLAWALLGMLGLVGSFQIVRGGTSRAKRVIGAISVAAFALGRVVLVLPGLPQPRIDIGPWNWPLGMAIFIAGLVFSSAALKIRPFDAPAESTPLRTTGLYALVRHPVYLGELLWSLGWSILFRSTTGVALTPVWWAALLSLALIEEDRLHRQLGTPYVDYQKQVRGRILPGLPL